MKVLYLDIETLPAEEGFKEELRSGEALSRSKKRELQARGKSLSEGEVEALYRDTSLSGDFGRVLCAGVRLDPEDSEARILAGTETEILRAFWDIAGRADLWVGHNILDFDLRFLYKRSVVLRVRTSREVPLARHSSEGVFDTMHEWNRWSGEMTSLDKLARVLGLKSSKGDLAGSQVYDAWRAGELERIHAYCRADVELTRSVHRRLAFLD